MHINTDLLLKVGIAAGEFLIAYVLGNVVNRIINWFARRKVQKGAFTFLASFINIAIKIVGIIIALDQLGVSMNVIISGLSALGLGIALALKDNMASVASGLQILLTKPFVLGDYIKVGSHEGVVKAIEITFTMLETRNDEIVIISNNKMISKMLVNYSSVPRRRIVIQYPCMKDDVAEKEKLLISAAKNCDLVLPDPKPEVIISSLHEQNATLELLCYTHAKDYWKCNSEIMANIYKLDKADTHEEQKEDLEEK